MPFCHFACGNCMKLPNWLKMIRWGVGAALPVPSIWIPKCNYDAITTQNPKAQYPRVTKKIRLVIFLPVAHESDLCGGKPWEETMIFWWTSSDPFTQWYSTVPPSENPKGSPMNLKGSRVEKNASRVEALNFLKTEVFMYFYMFVSIFA